MSKEADAVINAWQQGDNDARLKKPYKNPFKKNSQKSKHKAYNNGFKSR